MSAIHWGVSEDTPEGIEYHRYYTDPTDPTCTKKMKWTPYVVLKDGVWSDGVPIHPWQRIYAPEWEGELFRALWKITGLSEDKEKYDKIREKVEGWVKLAEERDNRKVSRERR